MKNKLFSAALALTLLLTGCASTVQSTYSKPNIKLNKYNRIIVRLVDASGASSLNTAMLITGSGVLLGGSMMKGDDQGIQALESLQFELMSIGFEFVGDEFHVDAFVDFTIGQIRYDPLAGWIADQATVKFRDAQSGQIIAYYKAKSQLITPTVNNIITNLAKAIKKDY